MPHSWRTQSPGKAIIFGEFAVLWGYEAIVLPLSDGITIDWVYHKSKEHAVFLEDSQYDWDQIRAEAFQVQRRYEEYLKEEINAKEILEHRDQLSLVCLAHAPEDLQQGQLFLRRASSLYEGAGLGSSAAVITALLKGFNGQGDLYKLACSIENYQHGKSSGVDIFVALHGQGTRYRQRTHQPLIYNIPRLTLLHTGIPSSNTAQSVALAQKNITKAMIESYPEKNITKALQSGCEKKWLTALKLNHRWLCELGVVPEKVARFIEELESLGSAAKISGAGTIVGDNAGAIIAWPHPDLPALATYYGYTLKENCSWSLQAQLMAQ